MIMISFKLFADTDIGLRDNNEDSFIVNRNLLYDNWEVPVNEQEIISLGEKGCLMVVADGMGGMNAGEVASAIAIQTVQDMFSPSKIPVEVVSKPDAIKSFMKKVIITADQQVKLHCKEYPDTEGMGSTIVMAWIVAGYAYIGWLGDSRAYSHLPGKGILRLTKDHSYVQELVDAKMLSEEEAMYHDQSNVITRSLGDASQKAKPDIISHRLAKNEIILLCSDGLCGYCADADIAGIIEDSSENLKNCQQALVNAALEADGSDNITVALLQITEIESKGENVLTHVVDLTKWKNALVAFLVCVLFAVIVVAGHKACGHASSGIVEGGDFINNPADSDSIQKLQETLTDSQHDSIDKQAEQITTKTIGKMQDGGNDTSLIHRAISGLTSNQSCETADENPEDELEISNVQGNESPSSIKNK